MGRNNENPELTSMKTLYLVEPCAECVRLGRTTWCENAIACDECGQPALRFDREADDGAQ